MRADRLGALLRLRGLAQAGAPRVLAARLARAPGADGARAAPEAAIRREHDAALDPDGGDEMVEAFAAWLPSGMAAAGAAREALAFRGAETSRARAELAAARAALEAANLLQARREAEEKREALRRQEAEIAEMTQRPRGRGG